MLWKENKNKNQFLNVSDLSQFIYCPRKLWLNKNVKIEEIETKEKILGKIMHELNDRISKKQSSIISLVYTDNKEEVINLFKKHYHKIIETLLKKYRKKLIEFNIDIFDLVKLFKIYIEDEASRQTQATVETIRKKDVFGDKLLQYIYPRKYSEYFVRSKELRLKGFVDLVEEYEEFLNVIEIKNTTIKNPTPYYRIQLFAYMVLMQEQSEKPVYGKLYYIIKEKNCIKEYNYKLNPFMKLEIKKVVDSIISLLNGKLPRIVNNEKCLNCSLKHICFNY